MECREPLRLPSFWLLQALGWGCYYLLMLAGSLPTLLADPRAIRDRALSPLLLFLVSSAMRPACRALLRKSWSWLALTLNTGALCLLGGAATAIASTTLIAGVGALLRPLTVSVSVQFAFVLFLWCSIYFGLQQWQRAARERERFLRAETAARDARLSALRSQLNPHFLFNSLNAVSTLVLDGKAAAANQMLAQIGDLLRSSLDAGATSEVPLAQEIALTEQYLAIEQTRLGERLHIELALDPATADALVPAMLLQPLVENAVRHGVVRQLEGGTVAIASARRGSRLHLAVRNSGPRHATPAERETNGIGLRNTAERLATLYGSDHRFSLRWPTGGGCEAAVELPFRTLPSPAPV
jgi:two-component system LytT family sensor kinase